MQRREGRRRSWSSDGDEAGLQLNAAAADWGEMAADDATANEDDAPSQLLRSMQASCRPGDP